MKFVIINFLLISNLILLLTGNTSFASQQCLDFISESKSYFMSLPGRGHQFTKSDFESLSPTLQYRVLALHEALEALDHPEVIQALKVINQPLDYFVSKDTRVSPPSELQLIIQNQASAKTVEDHYNFFHSQLKRTKSTEFSDRTLAGLSLLFSQIQRPRSKVQTIFQALNHPNDLSMEVFKRFLDDINKKKYAKAIIAFLRNPKAQTLTRESLAASHDVLISLSQDRISEYARTNKISFSQAEFMHKEKLNKVLTLDVDKIEDDFRKGKHFSKEQALHISALLGEFVELLKKHYLERTKSGFRILNLLRRKPPAFSEIARPLRLTIIEDYLVDYTGFRYGLEDLTDFFDHIMFGSSLPIRPEDLEISINNSVKSWLMPVRTQMSSIHTRISLAQKPQLSVQAPTPDKKLNPEYGHGSKDTTNPNTKLQIKTGQVLNPNKRKNRANQGAQKGSQNDSQYFAIEPSLSTESVKEMHQDIPDELNLIQFTGYSSDTRPLSELRDTVNYKFRFMRDGDDSRVYTINFERDVIKDLQNIPEIAAQLIRSLNLGFAKSIHEDGLKILKANKKGQPGRFYELKYRKSDVRVIMHHHDGYWRAIRVTDKLNLDRIISSYL